MRNYVTILSFSSRENGNCARISRFIEDYYIYSNIRTYAASNVISPCGNCNYSCLKPRERCPRITNDVEEIMETIMESQLVYFIVPNFCGFPCANYFAFNERTVGYFDKSQERMDRYMKIPKRFIIVSNTESNVFAEAMAQQVMDTPDILYLKTSKYGKRSINGDLLDSNDAAAELKAFLAMNPNDTVIIT